ncbi:MAG: hypothetical protein M3Y72_01375 [Acidobacteriota bacterium]|nr:hypothetical protein [Acidobacteriota bacterium]
MDQNFWLKLVQTLSGIATPIIVAVLGVLLLRRTEGVKAQAAKQSAFHVRWADEFFDSCQQFLRALEREIAILTFLTGRENNSDEEGIKMQHEQGEIHLLAYELQLRIKRCGVFAPETGDTVSELSEKCFSLVNKMVAERMGPLEPIFQGLNDFNKRARQAHAEMLALDTAKRRGASKPHIAPAARDIQSAIPHA